MVSKDAAKSTSRGNDLIHFDFMWIPEVGPPFAVEAGYIGIEFGNVTTQMYDHWKYKGVNCVIQVYN